VIAAAFTKGVFAASAVGVAIVVAAIRIEGAMIARRFAFASSRSAAGSHVANFGAAVAVEIATRAHAFAKGTFAADFVGVAVVIAAVGVKRAACALPSTAVVHGVLIHGEDF
jgi:hypothetical protein